KLEAAKLLSSDSASLSLTDRLRRCRVVAPPAMLLYCLIARGGILDGWAGFYYAFQRTLAELMLSLYLIDHDLNKPVQQEQHQPRTTADNADQKSEDVKKQVAGPAVS